MQQALESAQASARSPIHHLPQPPDAHILHGPLILPKLDAKNSSYGHLCKAGWSTSKDWLERQGLNARKLGLFQILSTNAYSQVTGYIPSIKRTVSAQIHEQCMVQMRWLDGTIKNVHVDHAQLFEYQKQLTSVVSLLEKRVHWLTKESRGYFGCVVEPHVVIMVDLSKHNAFYLVHIQYCLRHVLEQQISEQSTFNLIAIGSTVRAFRPNRVPVTATNLQAAWNWFRELSCMGTRNILAGLRFALENGVDRAIDNTPQGLYLFTSGIPDQEDHVIMPYLEAKRCQMPNFRLHVALYNVDDYDTVTGKVLPSRYGNITKTADTLRSIANSTGGRFHWFRETGIIESDDIRVLLDEIDCAVEYSQQCRSLVDSVQAKSVRDDEERSSDYPGSPIRINRMVSTEKTNKENKSIAPRLNALANSRKLLIQCRIARANNPLPSKALAWSRGVSSTSANSSRGADPMQPVGSVRVRPGSTPAGLKELTTRDWLRKYSLRSLGLTLLQLVSNAACRHEVSYVNPIRSHVEARYCTGLFPIVNVAGTLRHLQYTHSELELFKKEVKKALRRYVQRLDWLVSGSRRYFGVIAEQCVVILLDISGSMEPRLNELKYQVKCLVWEQLFKKNIVFNLIAFNSELADWQSTGPTVPDETACHDAVAWVEQLEAYGGTETAEAVCRALHHLNLVDPKTGVCPGARRPTWITPAPTVNKTQAVSKGIYLLTDGKPDASCKSVLKTIHDAWALNAQMESNAKEKNDKLTANNNATFGGKRSKKNKKRTMNVLDGPLIHTISFTQDETAGNFLRKLARMTGGRYHPVLNEAMCYSLKQRALSLDAKTESETHSGARPGVMGSTELPNTGGDDLDGLIREINGTLEIVEKIRYFQHVYSETKSHPRGQSVEEK
ncbi:von Willebrand factor A domain-containing protein 3A [Fasciola gigantica]|uniref:von Willebrand factor A domain-containing protein 3A n=1 Tax=Fasciola gigantica TaxID=46835 RepID=A0A504YTT3_FASGI|nr:von Willebrand factor A domain-containing protein 3A [Fasciola gigantica]